MNEKIHTQKIDRSRAKSITQYTQIVYVRDLDLAVALASIGVPLRDDPPMTTEEKQDGTKQVTFCFHPATLDGEASTMEMVKAWHDKVNFVTQNPQHPFTFAICTLMNRQKFLDEVKSSKPFVGYLLNNGRPIYVRKGTRKHDEVIKAGLKRIDDI